MNSSNELAFSCGDKVDLIAARRALFRSFSCFPERLFVSRNLRVHLQSIKLLFVNNYLVAAVSIGPSIGLKHSKKYN